MRMRKRKFGFVITTFAILLANAHIAVDIPVYFSNGS